MEYLYNIGLNDNDIINMFEMNNELKEVSFEDINKLCQLLEFIGCKDYHIRNILTANPFYLTRDIDDIKDLIQKLYSLGIECLETTFDSNPWLLNKDASEIDDYIKERQDEGLTTDEIIDEIDSGIFF